MSGKILTFSASRVGTLLLVAAWCCCAVVGLATMLDYDITPAPTRGALTHWPSASQLARDPICPTLVMFVHPRCPCSRASLSELGVLAAQCSQPVSLRALFVVPPDVPEQWEEAALWNTARQIPGVAVSSDGNGREAEAFGATASGETFLYGADGRLLFHGGITSSRGHAGENAGRAALAALINRGVADQSETHVYGCLLSNRCCRSNPASIHVSTSSHAP